MSKAFTLCDRSEEQLPVPRVLVVDDTTLFRQGILSLLNGLPTVEIVGEAADAQDAADMAGRLGPDVVLLDQDLPQPEPGEAITLLKQQHPATEVIVLSERMDPEEACSAFAAGASGYVLKDISLEGLADAISAVCQGRAAVHPFVARRLVERYRALAREREPQAPNPLMAALTPRELEIVFMVANGATDREIALKLDLAESTIKSHVRTILRKAGARNRTQAVVALLRGEPLP